FSCTEFVLPIDIGGHIYVRARQVKPTTKTEQPPPFYQPQKLELSGRRTGKSRQGWLKKQSATITKRPKTQNRLRGAPILRKTFEEANQTKAPNW
ncbi:MAG: hypothetical protein WD607_04675, partial [Candidatus Paceibacterota bacterium]